MSLLTQIQQDAISDSVSVTSLLRKCRILAARLEHGPLEAWVEHEQNGYPEDATLPPYRRAIPILLQGSFINAGWKAEGVAVPLTALPKGVVDEEALERAIRDPIGDVEHLANPDRDVVSFSMPAGLLPHVKVYEMMECYALWGEVSTMVFKNVLEQVRNRVLTFALEIEKENPGAGEAEPGSNPVASDKVTSMANNIFYGGTNTVAVGSPGATQNVTVGIAAGDLAGLMQHLKDLGIDDEGLSELRDAVEEDEEDRPEKELGPRVSAWLGKMAFRGAIGGWQVSAATGAHVLGAAIAHYYGIG